MRTTNVPRLFSSRLYCRYRNCTDSYQKGSRTLPPVRNFTYPQRLIYFVYELIVTLLLINALLYFLFLKNFKFYYYIIFYFVFVFVFKIIFKIMTSYDVKIYDMEFKNLLFLSLGLLFYHTISNRINELFSFKEINSTYVFLMLISFLQFFILIKIV